MFCRIDCLRRRVAAPNRRVVFSRFASADSQAEIEELALSECQARKVDGFRLHNLHTRKTKVVWAKSPI
jgi:hypothetical protein